MITLEEILEGLKDADNLAAVKDQFGFKTEEDVAGLLENQQKLKKEKLKLKAKLDQYGDLDPEDVSALNERIAELESGKKSDLSFKERMELDKLKKQVEENNKQGDFWKNKYVQAERDRAIDKILDENKVNPAFKKVLRSDLSTATKIIEEDGEISLIISTEKGDKPISDYAKEYFATDEGMVFLEKPINVGGGAAKASATGKSSESFSELAKQIQAGSQEAIFEAMKRIDTKQT